MVGKEKISLLILTYNAPYYIYKTLKSLRLTSGVDYEVVILDNKSRWPSRLLLLLLQRLGWIDKLCMLSYNSLFAGGNNIASQLADPAASHFLLLNSDVEIRDPQWLKRLLDLHEPGITSFGVVKGKPVTRVDGYCLLIDKHLYQERLLDEEFQWWWSVSKLQAQLLVAGYSVKGVDDHEAFLHHFGQKSGKGHLSAKGLYTEAEKVISWFQGKSISVIDRLDRAP